MDPDILLVLSFLVGALLGVVGFSLGYWSSERRHGNAWAEAKTTARWVVAVGGGGAHGDEIKVVLQRRARAPRRGASILEGITVGTVSSYSATFDTELDELLRRARERAMQLNVVLATLD